MRVISDKTLRVFWQKHPNSKEPLKAWFKEAESAQWLNPEDIKVDYPSASIIAGNRVVFNIKGNTYRLIVQIHYNMRVVYIRFVGTHAEYNRINAETI